MDGKHIPIVSPVEGEYAYVNRKNFCSINAQADARNFNMIFTDIVKWQNGRDFTTIPSPSAVDLNRVNMELNGCLVIAVMV